MIWDQGHRRYFRRQIHLFQSHFGIPLERELIPDHLQSVLDLAFGTFDGANLQFAVVGMRSDYDHSVRFVLDLGNETAVSSNQLPHQRLVKDELVERRHVGGYADAGDAGRGWGCDVAAPFTAVARTLLKKSCYSLYWFQLNRRFQLTKAIDQFIFQEYINTSIFVM